MNSLKVIYSIILTTFLLLGCKSELKNSPSLELTRFMQKDYYDWLGKPNFNYYDLDYKLTDYDPLICHMVQSTDDLNEVYEKYPDADFLTLSYRGKTREDTFLLDPVITKFTKLKRLDISCEGKMLDGIQIIEELKSLKRLTLSLHYQNSIDLNLEKLKMLQYLTLFMGKGKDFPIEILNATSIKFLELSGFNNLVEEYTFDGLENLKYLEHLKINSNKLKLKNNNEITNPNLKVYEHYSDRLNLVNSISYKDLKRCIIGQVVDEYPEDLSFDNLELLRIGSTSSFSDIHINRNLKVLQIDPRKNEDCEIDLSKFTNLKSLSIYGIEQLENLQDIQIVNIPELIINYEKVHDSIKDTRKTLNNYLQSRIEKSK